MFSIFIDGCRLVVQDCKNGQLVVDDSGGTLKYLVFNYGSMQSIVLWALLTPLDGSVVFLLSCYKNSGW